MRARHRISARLRRRRASAFVLDGELFETPLAGRIHNPALTQFCSAR
jgi:hypothetical protein